MLQADGGVHPTIEGRRKTAAGDVGLLGHASLRSPGDGAIRRIRQSEADNARSSILRRGGVARDGMGARGGAVHPGAGFPVACEGLAASFRGDFRLRRAESRARFFAPGDGSAKSSGCCIRVRADAEGLRFSLGDGPGAFRGESGRFGHRPPARAAPVGGAKLARRDAIDHRDHQDPGQRHQAGRADAAILRSERPFADRASAATPCSRW